MSFIVGMIMHPHVQAKAQAEIDAVIGNDRLPTVQDIKDLPYVNAVIKEALRWQSVVPLGLPHRSREDDEFRGYFIPAGSCVVVNLWWVPLALTREFY